MSSERKDTASHRTILLLCRTIDQFNGDQWGQRVCPDLYATAGQPYRCTHAGFPHMFFTDQKNRGLGRNQQNIVSFQGSRSFGRRLECITLFSHPQDKIALLVDVRLIFLVSETHIDQPHKAELKSWLLFFLREIVACLARSAFRIKLPHFASNILEASAISF